jgi:hypothetical protein
MSGAFALWWLALPVLLLPVWWHRQKRQRTQAEPLATARFLPAAAPQQLRVWQWVDRTLLLLRLLLLLGLIAWLVDVTVPWRGDTVFVDARLDRAWADAQIQAAGLGAARRNPLPAADPLAWLAAHEREWRPDARLALIASGDAVSMAAHLPALAHRVELRLQPSLPATTTTVHHVVLASPREGAWRALFSAFEAAGSGRERYRIQAAPDGQTELIVWDQPVPPNPAWRAPLWWAVQPAAFPELAGARRAGSLRVAEAQRGRVWAQDRWPVDERDPLAAARGLFEHRDGLLHDPLPYAAPTMTLAASAARSAEVATGAGRVLLAPLLALLFALERVLAHRAGRRLRASPPAVAAGSPGAAA